VIQACSPPAGSTLLSIRAGREPGINVWPGILHCTAPRHHANVASLHLQQELILAADFGHDALRLAWRRDMIGQGDHIEQVCADTTQVHPLTTDGQRPLNESVLLSDEIMWWLSAHNLTMSISTGHKQACCD